LEKQLIIRIDEDTKVLSLPEAMFLLVFQLFQQAVNMVLGGKMVWACPRCRSGRAIRGFRLPLADRFAPLLSLTRGTESYKNI